MNTNEIIDSLINSVPINTLPTTSVNNNNRKRHHSDMANMSEQPNRTTPTRQLSSSINLPITSAAHISNQIMSKAPSTHTLSTQSLASQAIQTTDDGTLLTMERRMDNKLEISSPQEYFSSMLKSRGYPGTTFCSLKCGYHNSPTQLQTKSYGVSLTKAIRSSDVSTATALITSGLHPNACNQFGESIVHAACRRGDYMMLRALIECQSSVQVTDDFGRTPLHDACWTSEPNFDSIRLLLDQDPWLLCIMDCRGSTPLGYVRKAHWAVWIGFLGAIADRYWPTIASSSSSMNDSSQEEGSLLKEPPLAFVEPNSNPLPDPKKENVTIDVIELLANGKLSPQDLENQMSNTGATKTLETTKSIEERRDNTSPIISRITFDPCRPHGSNATTMMKISS